MVSIEKPKIPDQPEIEKLGGIQELINRLGIGDLQSFVGAIMTVYTELFGTPEEKAEIARQRKEQKGEKAKKETETGLQTLKEDVDKDKGKKEEEEREPEVEVMPYEPGTKKPTLSPKHTFKDQVEAIYAQRDTPYTTHNLHEYFGREYKKFMIKKDPVTGVEPITFLGRPISGGINMIMLPFLRIAERDLMDQGLNYMPAQKIVRGFQDRNMCVGDEEGNKVLHETIPSFHKYGLAVDLDPDHNWPKDGRGTIPDEVMLAMARAGFNLGIMGDKSAYYLINDSMHFQMRFPPESAAGQAIINNSPIGKKYWDAVKPMYEEDRQQSV